MATIAELEILLRTRGLNRVKRDLNSVQRITGRIQRSIAAFAAVAVFRQLTRGIGSIVTTFASFDRTMADVTRTTGLMGEQLMELEGDLLNLSVAMSGSAQDFAAAASQAGRAGLRTREEIREVVKQAAAFGVVSQQSFETATTQLIGLSRAFKREDTAKAVQEIADTITVVGKEFAVTEAQIVKGLQRAAAAFGTTNLEISQAVTFIASVTEISQRAERSGTQLNSALFKMATQVKKLAKELDLGSEFMEEFEKDAGKAFSTLIEAVLELPTTTQQLNAFKKAMGLVGTKGAAVMGLQMDKLGVVLEKVKIAMRDGNITVKEAEGIFSSTGGVVGRVGDSFEALKTTLGRTFEEQIRGISQSIIDMNSALIAFNREVQKTQRLQGEASILRGEPGTTGVSRLDSQAIFEDEPEGGFGAVDELNTKMTDFNDHLRVMGNLFVEQYGTQIPDVLKIVDEKIVGTHIKVISLSEAINNTFGQTLKMAFEGLSRGIGDALAQSIVFGERFEDIFKNMMKNLLAEIISFLTAIIVKMIILRSLGFFLPIGAKESFAGFAGFAEGGFERDILGLQHGGVVKKPTVAMIGEAGPEAVVPLDKAGEVGLGGGVTINADVLFLEDEAAQDRFVRRLEGAFVRNSRRRTGGTTITMSDR